MPNRLSRFCDGVMEAGWLLAVILTPLFFNIYSSRVFEPDKIALLRSLGLVVGAAWLIKLISQGGPRYDQLLAGRRTWRDWLRVPLVLPVGAFVLSYLISTLLSISFYVSLFGSYQRMQATFTTFSYIAIAAAVAANMRRRAQVERLLTTVVITSLPISLYGILQRYELDPLPWGGDTVQRVTGHMGNAIFLSAYLIMATTVTLGRVVTSFRSILVESDHMTAHVVRATFYVFILALNLVAVFFTNSRGPWLGLAAGLFFFFVLLALHYRNRVLVLGTIGLAAATGVFILALNIPGGPLESVRQTPALSRLGAMLGEIQGETGTGRVRVLIWSGVVQLMTPHAPLQFPEGGADPWNTIRPLVGYGPEALYVAFNPFYPPELGQLEARNASPDRSHNETFDAIAFTGGLGLVVYLAMFLAVFYYGLKWLGLIRTARWRNLFVAIVLAAGAAGATGFMAWQGPQFFGVGLPFGMLLGLIGFLTLAALRPGETSLAPEAQAGPGESWRAVALISLIAAIIAHFTEIHFGIAIVSTRTHFWIYLGVMFVLGYALSPKAAAAPAAEAAEPPARGRGRGRTPRSAEARTAPSPWLPALLSGALGAALLLTLGFDFITNPTRLPSSGEVIVRSLTFNPIRNGGQPSYGILSLFVLTWAVGGVLAVIEESREAGRRAEPAAVAAALAASLVGGGFGWIILANHLAGIARFQPQSVEQLVQSANNVAGILTVFYGLMAAALIAWALMLMPATAGSGRARGNASPLAWLAYVSLPALAVYLAATLNLQAIQADVVYKTGVQMDDQGQPQAAVPLLQRTIDLAPSQDFYYLFLGRAYLNLSNVIQDPAQRDELFLTAQAKLHDARRLNPLNTDHTANLARLNRQWALVAADPAAREVHAQASDGYYAQAVTLSPFNAGLWNEWAALSFQVLSDGAQAEALIEKSLAIDDTFDQTYQFQGDLYAWQAQANPDAAARTALLQKALQAYDRGVQAAVKRGSSLIGIRLGKANAHVNLGQIDEAIQEYLLIAQQGIGANQWQVFRSIAELYRQKGDLGQARFYGEQALAAAPESDKWQLTLMIADYFLLEGNLPQARLYGEQALAAAPEANVPQVQAWLAALPPAP